VGQLGLSSSPGGSVVFCDKFLYYGNTVKEGTLQLIQVARPRNSNALNSFIVVDLSNNMFNTIIFANKKTILICGDS
jgi:hypothetical protein